MFFSIIVPVHNGRKHLKESVESALALDTGFMESGDSLYEIIIVENGSTDDTGRIADEIAADNKAVTVIHTGAVGLYSARQNGIRRAFGKWIIALDSDDLLDRNALKELYLYINHKESLGQKFDMVFFNAADLNDKGHALFKRNHDCSTGDVRKLFCRDDDLNSMWSKCIKRECAYLGDEELYLNYGEDLYQTTRYLDKTEGIVFLDKILYYYRQSEESITSSYSEAFLPNQKIVWNNLDEHVAKWGLTQEKALIDCRKSLTCSIAVCRIIYSDMSIFEKKRKLKALFKDTFYREYYNIELPKWAPEENVFVHQMQTSDNPMKSLLQNAAGFGIRTGIKKVLGRG